MKIGFLGLGNMGAPMAHNLLKAGHALVVFDINQTAVSSLTDAGATAAESPAAVAGHDVDMIITMLPAAVHVKSVYLGEGGLLAAVRKGVMLADCSTIDPHTAREIADIASRQGNLMIDAPVSGGTGGAAAGTLTFMVGGTEAAFSAAKPVLDAMGRKIVHCGPSGNGQVAKVANNMLLGISMAGAAEAMTLGVSLGMDAKILADIINTSTGRCWSTEVCNPYPGALETAPAARGYTGGFGCDLMLKDMGLAIEAARSVKRPVILGAVAQQLYQTLSLQGHGGEDFSAVVKLYSERQAGNPA